MKTIFIALISAFCLIATIHAYSTTDLQIQWIYEELKGDITPQNVQSWASAGTYQKNNEKGLLIKNDSTQDEDITKTFDNLPLHNILVLQFQIYQIGAFNNNEGYLVVIDNEEANATRFVPASNVRVLDDSTSVYVEFIAISHTSDSASINFRGLVQGGNQLAINNFKLGIIGCDSSCAQCVKYNYNSDPMPSFGDLVCKMCPDNSLFNQSKNSCQCNQGYVESYSNNLMSCVPQMCQPDAVYQELVDYGQRARVVVQSKVEAAAGANKLSVLIDTCHYFSVLSQTSYPYLKFEIFIFSNDQNGYVSLPSKYIASTVFGQNIKLSFPFSDLQSLVNSNTSNDVKGTQQQVIHFALRFNTCSGAVRVHYFKINFVNSGNSLLYIAAENVDYQKNLSTIAIDTFRSPQSLIKEYSFETKRYICVDSSCVTAATYQGYTQGQEVIAKIQFVQKQTQRPLQITAASLFTSSYSQNILSQITIISQSGGQIILKFVMPHLFSDFSSKQTINQVHFQLTYTFTESDAPASMLRTEQTTILLYEIQN